MSCPGKLDRLIPFAVNVQSVHALFFEAVQGRAFFPAFLSRSGKGREMFRQLSHLETMQLYQKSRDWLGS
jgi:hypothetical protein